MRFKVFDYAAFVLAVAVVIVFAVYAYGETGEGSVARVETERDEFVYTLQQSQEVDFEGPLGRTHVEIHEGRVRVTDSPCREKFCVASGWASRSGEWIACLPNRIFIRVEGGEEQPVDAQTY